MQERLLTWLKAHRLDVILVSLIVLITGIISAVNMTNYPQRFDDEGTYIAQAWAIEERGTLTHYTYWYDHPPAGWIQIAGYEAITNAQNRYHSSITGGREFMLIAHLATIILLFLLARRLGLGSLAATLGTLAYGLSPLVVDFSRYVLLDNVGLPWLIGAFVLALSPRRQISAAIGAAICMAIAVLSKETFIILLPVLVYTMWTHNDARNRRYLLAAFGVVFFMLTGMYVLYAALKNEFFPGPGHVSLLGAFAWQLSGRQGSGSIFNPISGAHNLLTYWLSFDHWLLLSGLISLPLTLFFRKLRPITLALIFGFLMLLRTGYLPYPYIIAVLPFAALTLAGLLHYAIILPLQAYRGSAFYRHWARVASLGMALGALIFVSPVWYAKLHAATTINQDTYNRQAIEWIDKHINHHGKRLVIESPMWTDLENKGFNNPDPIWVYKTETDPAIVKLIGSWKGVDYVILNGLTVNASDFNQAFPTVSQAIKHAKVVARFGENAQEILVYQVKH
ncbi:MAG TPA: hypothetical protein VLF39_02080 [Candidatus Saccharimonadales bacterium]|nr:hypothetical protein [Candidatus Saccharimonadales bacterium]